MAMMLLSMSVAAPMKLTLGLPVVVTIKDDVREDKTNVFKKKNQSKPISPLFHFFALK
jgi:hypothetical protein